ncbi:FAD binding protein-3 [Coleophoma cylindrospora]|uniref:FAD binding protein-3 n=1 Tax=Coleophoma cylindrospora TaxID=1849047 RepID=A0A3D8S205_9HELO|nr:FAD binding protein-3 [Coleophoma cylindrospora]
MSSSNSTGKRPFRVVLVGAGVAGLVLSNALQRAGIDHVVLEKHKEIVWPSGASIGIWPNGARLLDQLGCLEAVQNACAEMTAFYTRDPDGKAVSNSQLFDEIVERHGCRFLLLERQEFLKHLYECLPSKSPIKTGCAVSGISESPEGVRVFLADGSHEDGDMVIGCDGVASQVRQIMWYNANKALPNTITDGEMKSLTTSYKCLVGVSSPVPGVELSAMTVVHNEGFSFLLLTQPHMIFFFVFMKQDKTYHWPVFPKYTQDDVNMQAASLAALPFTPNIALGGMCAIESAASLVNLVRAKLVSSPLGLSSHPSQQELSDVFQAYRDQRIARVSQIFRLSALMTREQAWDNLLYKGVSKYVVPHMSDAIVASAFSEAVKGAVKLNFVTLHNNFEGTVPWDDGTGKLAAMNKSKGVMVAFGVLLLTYAAYRYGGIAHQY